MSIDEPQRTGRTDSSGDALRFCSIDDDDALRAALRFCIRVFDSSAAPMFPSEGRHTFHAFVMSGVIEQAVHEGRAQMYVCYDGDAAAGVLCMRDGNHISLLFVDDSHRRMGIATQLLGMALVGRQGEITVNAAPTGYEFYLSRGFEFTDTEELREGLIFTKMVLR